MTASAASVLAYLKSIQGQHSISGQYVESGPMTPVETVHNNTGKWVGLIGGNYWWAGSTAPAADLRFNALAKPYWDAGGLIMLSLFLPNPTTGGHLWDISRLNADAIVQPGTGENARYNTMIDSTITGLLELQAAGVVVIFRPLFENNGGWFWWGSGLMSPAQFRAIWRYMHDRIAARGVTNCLWLFAINAGPTTPPPNFPGEDVVDLVGQDLYSSQPTEGRQTYDMLTSTYPGKPMCLAEYGSGSPSHGDASFNEKTLIDAIKTTMPKTVLWEQWWSAGGYDWGIEAMQNQGALGDPWVLNRGDFTVTGLPPIVVPPVVTPPAGTLTRGSGGSLTDAAGRVWTLTPAGVVMSGGVAVPGGAGTAKLTIVGGVIYAQDAGGSGWYSWTNGAWVSRGQADPTVPVVPPIVPSVAAIVAQLNQIKADADAQRAEIQAQSDAAAAATVAANIKSTAQRAALQGKLDAGIAAVAAAIAKL